MPIEILFIIPPSEEADQYKGFEKTQAGGRMIGP
jgi:hypothetical protein